MKKEKPERQAVRDNFLTLFRPGAFWGILGPPRAGKSTLLSLFAEAAMRHGWIVFSNIKLRQWDPEKMRFRTNVKLPGYHFVKTWSQVFSILPKYAGMHYNEETRKYELRHRIMLCVDEVMMTDIGGGKNLQAGKTRSAVALASQAGKLGITIVIVAHSEKMITGTMRVGQLLFGYIRKVRKPGYNIQEMARFDIPNPDIERFDPDNSTHFLKAWRKVVPVGIARNQDDIALPEGGYDPNEVIYSSMTPASLTLGTYPGTSIPFNIDHMIEVLTDADEDRVSEAIANEMQNPPRAPGPGQKVTPKGDEETEPEEEHDAEERTGEIKNTIVALYKNGLTKAQITERIGRTRRSQVYKYCDMVDKGLL